MKLLGNSLGSHRKELNIGYLDDVLKKATWYKDQQGSKENYESSTEAGAHDDKRKKEDAIKLIFDKVGQNGRFT